jgi:hypothetical protein
MRVRRSASGEGLRPAALELFQDKTHQRDWCDPPGIGGGWTGLKGPVGVFAIFRLIRPPRATEAASGQGKPSSIQRFKMIR